MKTKSIYTLILLLSLVCVQAWGQGESKKRTVLITNKPFSFLFGANLGIETALSKKISIGGDVTTHFWLAEQNVGVFPTVKYYFRGEVGKGFYASGVLAGGYFFNKTAVENAPYYAGAGIGLGGITPLLDWDWFYLFGGFTFKYVHPLGYRAGSNTLDAKGGMAYYAFFSPASVVDLNVGIAIRL